MRPSERHAGRLAVGDHEAFRSSARHIDANGAGAERQRDAACEDEGGRTDVARAADTRTTLAVDRVERELHHPRTSIEVQPAWFAGNDQASLDRDGGDTDETMPAERQRRSAVDEDDAPIGAGGHWFAQDGKDDPVMSARLEGQRSAQARVASNQALRLRRHRAAPGTGTPPVTSRTTPPAA